MFFGWPYTDLHSLNLDWILTTLKDMKSKLGELPEKINEIVKEALSDANLAQIVGETLIQYGLAINVKMPGFDLTPAVGDGETDDTVALQAMIAYANANNMPMIFPPGVYRVTGLDVNVDTVFLGFDATLMLAPVSAKPLITLTAHLATSGLTLNGNLGGQTTVQNIINIVNGSFAITNSTIMGGASCIEGTLVGESIIGDSYLLNFQEYGIHANGTGSFTASNVVVPSVATGGAMCFMRIDCDNCSVSNFSSKASVPNGFEIAGNNNAISANIPNAEASVNDSGSGNTWTITGKDEKRYFEGNASFNVENYSENVSGNYSGSYGEVNHTSENDYNINGEKIHLKGTDIQLNPTNPLTYKTPTEINEYFSSVPAKDASGKRYDVLVRGASIEKLGTSINIVDATNPPVGLEPVHGDGITDDITLIEKLVNYCQLNNCVLFIPCICALSRTLEISSPITIMGLGADYTNLDTNGSIFQNVKSGFKAISENSGAVLRLTGNNGGFRLSGFSIDGNNLAQHGLRVDRQRNSLFENLEIASTVDAALFIVPSKGTYNNDNFMFNTFLNITMLKVGKGIYASGNLDTGNVCHNLFANLNIAYNGGWGILLDDTDNNTFIGTYIFKYPDATSEYDITLESNSRSNVFFHLQGTVYATGSSRNSIFHYDRENGQKAPVAEAASGQGSLFWTEMGHYSEGWQMTNPMRNLIAELTQDAITTAQYNGYDNGAFQIKRDNRFMKIGIDDDTVGTITIYSSNGDIIDKVAVFDNRGFARQKWGGKIYRTSDRAPISGEGNNNVGDIVFNNMSTSQQYIGWVCIAAGDPGTWRGFGEVASS